MNDVTKQIQVLAEPLASFLARLHVSHPAHQTVCAEIYDVVNEIRDKEIARLRGLLINSNQPENYKAAIETKIKFFEGN